MACCPNVFGYETPNAPSAFMWFVGKGMDDLLERQNVVVHAPYGPSETALCYHRQRGTHLPRLASVEDVSHTSADATGGWSYSVVCQCPSAEDVLRYDAETYVITKNCEVAGRRIYQVLRKDGDNYDAEVCQAY
jgi:hypothetical protein